MPANNTARRSFLGAAGLLGLTMQREANAQDAARRANHVTAYGIDPDTYWPLLGAQPGRRNPGRHALGLGFFNQPADGSDAR